MEWTDILWILIYTALGLAILYFTFRVRKLRAEWKELQEQEKNGGAPEEDRPEE